MYKAMRLFFAACFVSLLASALFLNALTYLGIELPQAFELDKETSVLEGREYEHFPRPSISALVEGSFQKNFEQYAADSIPYRDGVLLANAALQRSSIAASARLSGFSVYPTFYGSNYAYGQEKDILAPIVSKKNEDRECSLEKVADSVNLLAAAHPELNIVFGEVDRMEYSQGNPTALLVSNSMDRGFVNDHLLSNLAPSIKTVDIEAKSENDFLSYYFKSDHHWNIEGAYRGYALALESLMPSEEPITITGIKTWDRLPFFGSKTRAGLCEIEEAEFIEDVIYDKSDLTVAINGKNVEEEALVHADRYGSHKESIERYANRYAEYFHTDYGLIEINNEDKNAKRSLLIIGDSFSNCIERLFAEHYSTVYCLDPRHFDGTVEQFLGDHPVDDLLFLVGGTTYTTDAFLDCVGGANE